MIISQIKNILHKNKEYIWIDTLNIAAGIIGRVIFVLLSEYNENLKGAMTDIDMTVYSKGARAFIRCGSTDSVPEFKYAPLVAILALPLAYSTLAFKLCISLLDVLCGILYSLISAKLYGRKCGSITLTMYVYNPLLVAIACRGSFEAPCSICIALGILFYLESTNAFPQGNSKKKNKKQMYLFLSGILFGIAAQLRIYPIIFWPTLVLATGSYMFTNGFVLGVFPVIFGLKQAFMFHVGRVDIWHNISVWWEALLSLSLVDAGEEYSHSVKLERLLAIIPIAAQLFMTMLPCLNILRYNGTRTRNVVAVMFSQALLFVAFSKVQTAQYWAWWLPLGCVLGSRIPFRWMLLCALFSAVGISWNGPSYDIESLKINKFSSIVWINRAVFIIHLLIMVCM